MADQTQPCPICGRALPFYERYPHYVCIECVMEAVDENGRPLEFLNEDLNGGYVARYRGTKELRGSHDCYIRGTLCWAGEAYMGGIVVRLPVT